MQNNTCDFDELLATLSEIVEEPVNLADENIDNCEDLLNYCDDFNAFGMKRQSEERRAVRVISMGYLSQEEADEAYQTLVETIQGGGVEDVEEIFETACGDCVNQCKDCGLEGVWHRVETGDCEEFEGCPDGENGKITVRTVLEFRGEDMSGKNQGILVKQYWDFGSGDCQGTWEGAYRFYSDATNCDNRVSLLAESCEVRCDEGVGEGEEGMVCQVGNVPLENEFSGVEFSGVGCLAVELQGENWEEGPGFVPLDDDTDSGAGGMGVSIVVGGMMALLMVVAL